MARRSNPFEDLAELVDRLSQEFETAARSWNPDDTRGGFGWSLEEREPSIDLADHGDAFVVTADVPGYAADDLESRLSNGTLHISGTRSETDETTDETFIRRERTTQSFDRRVSIPEPVDSDGVSATLNNGVLTIRLEKAEPTAGQVGIDIE
ncbi:Hsp20/alpha crystallin family protein [Natrialbaceae archaeon A-CW2]|uniref:Hsp20/alpha crystallin family protein n=1 Tax=Natronosalvus amylolyticus TaxID=2961994 RepID=UPI0020C9B182|nr:Hsp20/alpha crystallin family protein [Natronosalvus amylolyticus]